MQPTRRNWAAIGLAAAIAAPFGLVQLTQLHAQDVKPEQLAGPRPSDADLVRQATDEFRQRQFEQAEKTLAGIKLEALSKTDREAYLSLVTDVKHAAIECRGAQEQFLTGEDALKGQQELEAIGHFKAVALNRFADEATVKKAQARLALLNGAPAQRERVARASDVVEAAVSVPASPTGDLSPKQRYELGLSQYRGGNWADARKNLEMAKSGGYTPESIYQDSPVDILARIDARDKVNHERQRVQKLAQATTEQATQNNANDPLGALKATPDSEARRRQEAATRAQQLVQDAQAAERANNFERASSLYSQAAEIDPNNTAAISGRDHTMSLMGRNPGPTNLPDQASNDIKARQGEIRYQIQSNLDQAHAAIAQQNWGAAQIAIDRARLAAGLDPSIFPADTIRAFRTQIDQTDLELRRAQSEAQVATDAKTTLNIQQKIELERQQAMEDRQRTIGDLIRTARNLTDQGKYREALQTVDQILVLDPANDYAVGVKPLLEDKVQFAQQRQFFEQQRKLTGDQYVRIEEQLIPYNDILRYPTDWPDISQTRDQTIAAERSAGGADRLTVAQLDHSLPALQFDAVGFSDVIDFLRDVSGANLFVNWKSLEAAGIDRNTPVSASLRNIKFSKALSIILESVGGGQTKLGYTVDEGVITISTADDLSRNVVVRVYDIRDLIVSIPDFTDAPNFSIDASQNQGGGGGGGQPLGQGGGGGGQTTVTNQLFQNANQIGQNGRNQGPTRQDLVDSITKLIEDTVSTDSWKDNGGSVGALRELEGQLIVTQTPENHRQLINLLEQLREERAIQVTVETRFLTVQRNFVEDVGVDLNFLFNLNSSWSSKFGTIPITSPSSTFTANPTTGVPGSIGSSATTPTGLTTSATYLDDFQVSLVMRAIQASVTSTILTAPRVTLFNGQRAYVLVSTTRAYVSNLTPVVSTGISAFAPTVANTQSGIVLDVQATVSADRKYVTLTLRPSLNTLLDLLPFTFQTGASVVSNSNGVGTTTVSPSGTIQQPESQITQVRTSVSVPDGGTLLLGGQTLAGETEREIGVPVLSKIPFLKRLFTNKSVAKDEQILLILVRPTIIMQREIEQKQFPLLQSKLSSS